MHDVGVGTDGDITEERTGISLHQGSHRSNQGARMPRVATAVHVELLQDGNSYEAGKDTQMVRMARTRMLRW